MIGESSERFALYLHIPFCLKKCPYCDFNSYSVGGLLVGETEQAYLNAILTELTNAAAKPLWKSRELASIFFGGGTPTLLSISAFKAVFSAIRQNFDFAPQCEVTVEANPRSLELGGCDRGPILSPSQKQSSGLFQEWRSPVGAGFKPALTNAQLDYLSSLSALGINRLSLGVQSFSSRKLKALGRIHSVEDVYRCIELSRKAGFSNLSLDLMFGAPGESPEEWLKDIEIALGQSAEHLSLYSLTVEPATPFMALKERGLLELPSEEEVTAMMRCATTLLSNASYFQYEISNYAKKGYQCRHNLNYWDGGDYLGLGAGAHSFWRHKNRDLERNTDNEYGLRWSNTKSVDDYISSLLQTGLSIAYSENIDKNMAKIEFIMLRLRKKLGFSRNEYEAAFNEAIPEKMQSLIEQYIARGIMESDETRFFLSRDGVFLADSVISGLIAEI